MTITRQQIDAWDDAVDAAYEQGRQEGMKQERALWELTKLGQEIEAQPAQRPWVGFTDEEREVLWAAGYHHDTLLMVEESLKRRNT